MALQLKEPVIVSKMAARKKRKKITGNFAPTKKNYGQL
ncbi:hypothetical protein LTSERUB_4567 [Salmonella enterica subsp. enterica serovar Rubislaw str. A4-653]|uniref:Uncharacterized protein n=1 Tax=Salmonella enterica subsp. enterica serovar Rubislaw str. A4-653 TaxID=913081 RepID=G5QNN5_SALRU|nr:hypothetical protein LTSERUB_4567 [Salmonella enterica subsp. enterica serovar Rubislaw str. A4-653]